MLVDLPDIGSMLDLIARWDQLRDEISHVDGPRTPLDHAVLLPPIPQPPRNLFCVGWNYPAHFDEGRDGSSRTVEEYPKHPTFFTKATTTVLGPHAPIPLHGRISAELDWEVELGVVVAEGGRDMTDVSARQAIFGYFVANDVSARDVQFRHGGQWFKGKSLDGTCPIGPWIVTADEIDLDEPLEITCRVNGAVKQRALISDMAFPVPEILRRLSEGMTLIPGDLILTGTPPGVGFSREPSEFLREGDVVESEIEGIGLLRNRVGTDGD